MNPLSEWSSSRPQYSIVSYRWESQGRLPYTTRLRRLWNAVLEADLLRPWGERKSLTNDTNDTKMEDMKDMVVDDPYEKAFGQGAPIVAAAVAAHEDFAAVVHPPHYNHGKIEVLDIIDAFPHLNYNLLVALKYILRAPYKNRQQDLRKAIRHLEHMIELMDKGELGYSGETKA